MEKDDDEISFGRIMICFFVPLVGLIIYAINKSTRPNYAKEHLKASLVSICIILIHWLLPYCMSNIVTIIILIIILQALLWGVLAGNIYKGKGGEFKTGFIFGFMLGVIGLLIVAVQRDKNEVSNYNPTEALKELQKLKESGAISQQEFEESKQKILSKL